MHAIVQLLVLRVRPDLQPTPSAPTRCYPVGSNEMRGADIIAEYLVKEKVPYIAGMY